MIVQNVTFYLLSLISIISGTMVILSRNPVYSVLWLILTFFNVSGLFLLAGAEFLAMVLIVVYVGAVMVLFLFIIMMININTYQVLRIYNMPLIIISSILLLELICMSMNWYFNPYMISYMSSSTSKSNSILTNTHALGNIMYTDYGYLFQLAGLLLLVAMIGVITLNLRIRTNNIIKKQNIRQQLSRNLHNSVQIKKVPIGRGI